ncbi:Plasmodium exported protein, unknown function [Plasmodium knowlesi strain H]|uniref:Uncharacterized protein n=3 Tax=Plasmodium knowlesi TaxID=5850 RepID=A0A5K1UUK1_PLAKH|nr:Plasmodium exported protein, unknown function [Plasmodium knowlesi strain H]OTN64762.1 Uncharacterized protein PKNOH_S130166400 [Plasmodium knowlesi]CAA9988837.1 Plasmodium exported protein, unknown function [Plasmodium knowlesi strain H]SBO24660.1 Plasmodium exported protein, unknown function [Plasmodium knowlesi strain H]SBO27946.1 Plasmodium exported protein, unknown function [Plasmodium knowlesi strain H]VVS78311.1 Plasmodium exported protein, unknown function [Plasmodium knowlesi strai|eukprot:XP_002261184.1 hypothetical protein, conserved in Plasmodium species [Plasmodium knowlesi strain H]
MVYPKDRRLLVYPLLIVYFILLWTVPLSLNGERQVGTWTRTYPSGCARSLSESSISTDHGLIEQKKDTKCNQDTSRSCHNNMKETGHSHTGVHGGGCRSDESLASGCDAGRNKKAHVHQTCESYTYETCDGYPYHTYGGYPHPTYGGYPHPPYGGYPHPPYGGYPNPPYGGYPNPTIGTYPHPTYGGYPHPTYAAGARQYYGTMYPNMRTHIVGGYRSVLPFT